MKYQLDAEIESSGLSRRTEHELVASANILLLAFMMPPR